jgi:protein-L-isoaspartate(D-aspartate) O-methyltransferase
MFTNNESTDTLVHQGKRKKLAQLMAEKGITNEFVLDAIRKVPRHWFFPKDFEQYAYRDAAFPINHGQTISQPFTVAFQSQLIDIKQNDKVLEVGTGSGYQAAILSEMGVELYSIEYIKPLLEEAAKILSVVNPNIKLFHGDGSLGLPKHAPFDAIIVTAGAPIVPDALKLQLKVGGKLVIPVGTERENQIMLRIIRISETQFQQERYGDFKFVPLKGNQGWEI